jgi:hypothetical protein
MAMANSMTALLDKLKEDLHMQMIYRHLPDEIKMPEWEQRILKKTMPTFSRYFPHKVPFVVSEATCNVKKVKGQNVYYIKDEYLGSLKVLGVQDIDWSDTSTNNMGLYKPREFSPQGNFLEYQMLQDNLSLYNDNIYPEFEYPNKITLTRVGGSYISAHTFSLKLLVEHRNLATISPTKMEVFEELAAADVANFIYGNLKYVDKAEFTYINVDLLLDDLRSIAENRPNIIEKLENSYVSAANDNIPYIMTVSG